ncbi:MAG TPA: hypothetical protein VG013_37535 [Gemmataceae bacterium]|jgi:hypothetical protein|nr:hypothetical protein [Gemmataceae bacterium]
MIWRRLAVGLGTVLAVVAWTGSAGAGDTLRLGGQGDARTMTLELKGGADTLPVGWHRGWGGWRHGWVGWRRGWGWRPGWRWGWGGYGYPGFYTGLYFPRFFGFNLPLGRPYYYAVPYDECPILDGSGYGSATGSTAPRTYMLQPPKEVLPPPTSAPDDETYPYDGGPQDPVPMPKAAPAPTGKPPAKGKVAAGRVVSVPAARSSRFAYRAYGQPARRSAHAEDVPVLIVKRSKSHGERP